MKTSKPPTIKAPHYEPRPFSMDEYLEFVLSNLKNAKKRKAKLTRLKPVNVPFVIR